MRLRLLETAVFALLLTGFSGVARAQPEEPAAQPAAEPRLALDGASCALKCNNNADCKAPRVKPHFCDYLGTAGIGAFNKQEYEEQQQTLKSEARKADQLHAKYESDKTALLAATDPKTIPETVKAESLHTKLLNMKAKVNDEGVQIASAFLPGARSLHHEEPYLAPLSARIKELDAKLGLAKTETAKKNEDIKQKMAAKMADGPDNKSEVGRVKSQVAKKTDGKEMFDGDTRKGGSRGLASRSTLAPELRNDAVAGGAMRGNFSDRYKEHVNDGALGGHAPEQHAAAQPGHAEKEKPKEDNFWVKRVKAEQAIIEDHGTEMLINANRHSDLADNNKAKQDAAAKAEWAKGNYGSAAMEKVKGWGSYAYHTTAQVGYTGVAITDAVKQGELDVMRGDPVAVKKVAIGGAAIAAVVTLGASIPATAAIGGVAVGGTAAAGSVTTAGLVGGGLSATSAYMTTKGITEGAGRVARADSVKEAAIGGAEVAANALAAPIASGIGKGVAAGTKAVGLAGPLEKLGAATVKYGADKLEKWGITKGSDAAARALTEKAETVAIQAAEKAAIKTGVQAAEKSVVNAAERQVVAAAEHEVAHAAGGHLAKETIHFGTEQGVDKVAHAAIHNVEHTDAHHEEPVQGVTAPSHDYSMANRNEQHDD